VPVGYSRPREAYQQVLYQAEDLPSNNSSFYSSVIPP
jgi:hypothetical protein